MGRRKAPVPALKATRTTLTVNVLPFCVTHKLIPTGPRSAHSKNWSTSSPNVSKWSVRGRELYQRVKNGSSSWTVIQYISARRTYPDLILLLIPATFTVWLQPLDISFNYLFKALLRREAGRWSSKLVLEKLQLAEPRPNAD